MTGAATTRGQIDIVMIGFPGKKRTTYAITWGTEKGRRWLRRYFRGDGITVDGRTVYHLGRKKLADFVGMVLTTHGLSYRTIEL